MFNITGYKYAYLLIILFILIVFTNSCNESTAINKIKEGEIEFEIIYLDNERENPLISLLPRKMITVFKNNSTHSLIEGFWGTFKLTYITNHDKGKNITLFQILDKKYMYLADTSAVPFGYHTTIELKLFYTEKMKNIAGYECNHAIAVFLNSNDTVQLYYTNQLGIENPNSNNPYKEINGVLLEFSLNLAGINMKFTAIRVNGKKVNRKKFDIPSGYKMVSKDEMEKIVNEYNSVADK